MANFVRFLVLGFLAVIHATNGDHHIHHFYQHYMMGCKYEPDTVKYEDFYVCVLEHSGIFNKKTGHVDIKVFKEKLHRSLKHQLQDPDEAKRIARLEKQYTECVKGKKFDETIKVVQEFRRCKLDPSFLANF